MSATFERIRALALTGDVRISDHGYDEMSEENILARDVVNGVLDGVVVEDYPTYKGTLRANLAIGSRPAASPCRMGHP